MERFYLSKNKKIEIHYLNTKCVYYNMMRSYNDNLMVKYNHSTYCSKNAALVDLYGNILQNENGNTVNIWQGLKSLKEAGKVKIGKDVSTLAGQGFVYLYTSEEQKNIFDNFRKSKNKDWTGKQKFHVYLEPLPNGDVIRHKSRSNKIVETDEDGYNYMYDKGR